MRNDTHRNCEGVVRRDFLKIGSAGLLGLTLPDLLRLESRAAGATATATPKAKSVIVLWLPGGPATIDMWDNKPDAPEGIRGEFQSIDCKAPGMRISEHLPKMAAIGDKVTLVRSLHHTIPSHSPATVFMTTGNKPTSAIQYPAMGSLASKLLAVDKGIPAYVSFSDIRGGNAGQGGFLGAGYNPFTVEGMGGGGKGKGASGEGARVRGISLPTGFTQDDLTRRDRLLKSFDGGLKALDEAGDLVDGLDSFHKQAIDILQSDKTKRAFDLSGEKQATRDMYGAGVGIAALSARRLVEAGVRFVTMSIGGWDTHANNFASLKDKNLPALDTVLSALIRDLDERGLLDSTIVMCAGEFGRTPKINAKAGRDHWARSMACVLAGGGIQRGYVHGSTDASGMAPATDAVMPDDISATIFHQLGIAPTTEIQSPTGRPITIFREGKVVDKMIG